MKIPFYHPYHEFEEVIGLDPIPSATGKPLKTYKCTHCGIMGTVRGEWLFLSESAHRVHNRAQICVERARNARGLLILIDRDDLAEKYGPHYAIFRAGMVVKPAQVGTMCSSEGIPVYASCGGILPLRPGDFSVIRTRVRVRSRNG